MTIRHRLQRVEAIMQSRAPGHHRPVIQVPWEIDTQTYLATRPCVCGERDCALKTFGLVVPQPLTEAQWDAQVQAYDEARRHDA